MRRIVWQDAPGGWANAQTCGSLMNGFTNMFSFPSLFLPVYSIKPNSQPLIQAGDDEKNQRTITVNPAHMGKAFKVMNELRRYFFYLACTLSEGTCRASFIRDQEQKSERHHLVNSDSFPTHSQSLGFLPLFKFWDRTTLPENLSFLCIYLTPIILVINHRGKFLCS